MRSYPISVETAVRPIEACRWHPIGASVADSATSLIPPLLNQDALDEVWQGRRSLYDAAPDRPTLAGAALLLNAFECLPPLTTKDLCLPERLQCHVNQGISQWASCIEGHDPILEGRAYAVEMQLPTQHIARWLTMLIDQQTQYRELARGWVSDRSTTPLIVEAIAIFLEEYHALLLGRNDYGLNLMFTSCYDRLEVIPEFVAFEFDTENLSDGVADRVRLALRRIDEIARPIAVPERHTDHFNFLNEEAFDEISMVDNALQENGINTDMLNEQSYKTITNEMDLNFIADLSEYPYFKDKSNSLSRIEALWDKTRLETISIIDTDALSEKEKNIVFVCTEIIEELSKIAHPWSSFNYLDGCLICTPIIMHENKDFKDDFQFSYEGFMSCDESFGSISLGEDPARIVEFITTFALGGKLLIKLLMTVEEFSSNYAGQEKSHENRNR